MSIDQLFQRAVALIGAGDVPALERLLIEHPELARERLVAPGPWLRATAIAGAAGCLLAVASGTAGWDTAHRLLAALALPPLIALAIGAWTTHRALLKPALASVLLFAAAAAVTGEVAHVALATLAFASATVTAALTFRGRPAASGRPPP